MLYSYEKLNIRSSPGFAKMRERERERKKKKIRVTSAVHNFIDTSYYGSLYYYLVIE